MGFLTVLFNSALLAGSALAVRGPLPRAEPSGSVVLTIPTGEPLSLASSAPASPPPGTASPVPAPSGPQGAGPKCGKGYTYCGYMLTANGHNFANNDISKAYCSGLSELCSNGKTKTDVSEAVFVCMDEQPSSVELLCACSGKCRNDAESNFIAHCDKPCING
ncbi:uncharacterized protein F4822DRAFT_442510 [Hypoxylon trugodes]|uniref:uncharacterized protein n=1 Tax=Hypoxylon trugodes TaxID=326681 RepID=UPI00219D91E5|nr:uncharacterized protein F4822DRAFT_442510 [Hypoxylon trugodes]KAI1391566.1 hypothetical protein F4822DRAFT_442510 [Hypoxylon trugodes]